MTEKWQVGGVGQSGALLTDLLKLLIELTMNY